MKTKNHLFDLVQSLNRGECRSFALYINRYQTKVKKTIVLLYEALKKQEEYDENILRKQLKWTASNFAFQKHELIKCILDFLQDFHRELDHRTEINSLTNKGYLLVKRRQYGLAEKVLNKALKLAKKKEEFHLMPQIYYLKNYIYKDLAVTDKKKQKVWLEGLDEMVENAQHLVSEFRCCHLNQRMYMLHLIDVEKDHSFALEQFKEIEKEPFFLDESLATTFMGKNHLLFAKKLYYRTIQKPLDELHYQQKLNGLFEEYPQMLPSQFSAFLSHAFNNIVLLNSLGKHGEANAELNKAKTYPAQYSDLFNERITLVYYILYYSVGLNSLTHVYEFEKILQIVKEEQAQIQKIIAIDEISFWEYYFNAILSNFYLGNHEKCLELIGEVEAQQDVHSKPRFYFGMKTMGVLSHFELDQAGLQESNFNALYFFARKQKLNDPSYKMVLKLLRKLNNLPELEAVEFYKSIYDDFDFNRDFNKVERTVQNWLKCKIRGISFSEIMKERKKELEEEIKMEGGLLA